MKKRHIRLTVLATALLAAAVLVGAVPSEDQPGAADSTNATSAVEDRAPEAKPRPKFRPKEEIPVDAAVDFPSDI